MPVLRNGEVDLNWMAVGEGPGLLFIHGAGGNAAVWWQQVEAFAQTHRVVTYDHRSFGRSTRTQGVFGGDELVSDARAVMEAAGISKAAVVGQSLGGWTALRLALKSPECVTHLCLSCTMAGIAHAPAIDALRSSVAKMDEHGLASLALGTEIVKTNPAKAYLYEQLSAFNEGLSAEARQGLLDPESLIGLDRLQDVKCPALILAGEHDAIWSPASLSGIAEAFPNGRLAVIRNSGHSPYFERPDKFNEALSELIR